VTTPPPPAGQPAPNPTTKKGSSNALLYTAIAAIGAGGAYYLFASSDDAKALNRKVEADEREIKQRLQQTVEATKARGDDAYKQTQLKYDETKAKYDSYKNQVKDSVVHARDSTESLYNEARSNAERKAAELKAEADRKAHEAKQGWFSWLGWGKSRWQRESTKWHLHLKTRNGLVHMKSRRLLGM
ncbi:hypothetical protein BDQ17DRAFT_1250692, partial [Cyathus striatus]